MGLRRHSRFFPRALPWAVIFRPVGAKERMRLRNNCAEPYCRTRGKGRRIASALFLTDAQLPSQDSTSVSYSMLSTLVLAGSGSLRLRCAWPSTSSRPLPEFTHKSRSPVRGVRATIGSGGARGGTGGGGGSSSNGSGSVGSGASGGSSGAGLSDCMLRETLYRGFRCGWQ